MPVLAGRRSRSAAQSCVSGRVNPALLGKLLRLLKAMKRCIPPPAPVPRERYVPLNWVAGSAAGGLKRRADLFNRDQGTNDVVTETPSLKNGVMYARIAAPAVGPSMLSNKPSSPTGP